jgi:hypothetical protein
VTIAKKTCAGAAVALNMGRMSSSGNSGRKTVKGRATSAPKEIRATPTPARQAPTTEAVAKRAFELFLARGGEQGHDVEDWLQAEHELGK